MGTSMRKVVFTENVIRGIQIWQDKAKKNINITQGEIVSEQQESENQASNLSSFQGFNLQL